MTSYIIITKKDPLSENNLTNYYSKTRFRSMTMPTGIVINKMISKTNLILSLTYRKWLTACN